MRLLIAGGGTGGHLFPGIAVAEEFLGRDSANEVLFVGSHRGIEARLLPTLDYRVELISSAGIRGKSGVSKIKGMLMLLYGYSQSRAIMKSFQPDLVLGVGGYASGPVVLSARGMGITCFIHEQNAIPGITNKILARVSKKVFISLEESHRFFSPGVTLLTGNPLRQKIVAAVNNKEKSVSPDGCFNLLVFGGSAGAHSVNMAVVKALPFFRHIRERLHITHQTGENDLSEVRDAYSHEGIQASVVPFIDDMAAAYSVASLVLCRAGATTIAEVTACGKACIFIPYPFAVDDHQRKNAESLLKEGACLMFLERELSGERLAQQVIELMDDPQELDMICENARHLARIDAAKVIVDEMLKAFES